MLAGVQVTATIDGVPAEVLSSGPPGKWESFINPNIDPNIDAIVDTCTEYMGSEPPTESRENQESCYDQSLRHARISPRSAPGASAR